MTGGCSFLLDYTIIALTYNIHMPRVARLDSPGLLQPVIVRSIEKRISAIDKLKKDRPPSPRWVSVVPSSDTIATRSG